MLAIEMNMRKTKNLIALGMLFLLAAPVWGEQPCRRIVSQAPYITKTLEWLGLERCIVGVSRYDTRKLPHTGGVLDPDLAAMAALKPDLIFAADWVEPRTLAMATPPGARAFRLHGFQSMRQIEENLRVIGAAAGVTDIELHVADFHRKWTASVGRVGGRGQRALLLSLCSGEPYSFGRETWLSDLFEKAGFVNAENHTGIHMLPAGNGMAAVSQLVEQLRPQVVFLIHQKEGEQCRLLPFPSTLRIVHLDGAIFLDPAPTLLEGLMQLSSVNETSSPDSSPTY
jgi:iron complex transport system substrate-binding protein